MYPVRLTFESSVEAEAPGTHEHVPNESDQEYTVMAMLPAADNAFDGQVYEEEVGQSIDNLCRIWGRIVVLEYVSSRHCEIVHEWCDQPLHTNSG